jgi:hypothetical protein
MSNVKRNIFFYKVRPAEGEQWRRADVLGSLAGLGDVDRLLDLGGDNPARAKVDRVPTTSGQQSAGSRGPGQRQ